MTIPTTPTRRPRQVAAAIAAATLTLAAAAQPAAPEGQLQISASASREVAQDVITIVMSTTHDGAAAQAVQAALRQALDAALREARRSIRPGEVEVRTGNFTLFPRHGGKGEMVGWRGSAELVIEGRDIAAIAQLSGRIETLTVARVGYSLSREQREQVEAEVAAAAIARSRARAADYARQFGYGGYLIREVQVSSADAPPPVPMLRARTMALEAAEAPLPVEAGKATVTVSVSGTVQMLK
jgi:predicted secreted protein